MMGGMNPSTTVPILLPNSSFFRQTDFTTSPRDESTTGDHMGHTSEEFMSSPATTASPPERQLSLAYTAAEAVVSLLAIFGNALVVYVFCTNRSLRRYRNYYIFALAIADFLVGLLGIPLAILASVGLPSNLYGCLFTVSALMVLCTISILCLVAVSIDRYWATTNPFAYYRHMTTSTAVGIILSCWIVGAIIGFLPLFGWYNADGFSGNCYFTEVMDYNYLVFLYFATIVFPAILMAAFYGYIYHVVLIKIRQKGNLAPQIRRPSEQSRTGSLNSDQRGASQIMRIIVSEKRREAKAAHKLGIIVLFFLICWMPLYTINCVQAFCPACEVPIQLLNFTIILSHANSSLNPLLYAYHLKEFRSSMKNALLLLFEKCLCGLTNFRVQKDPFTGHMSRSQTMPSLAQQAATIANSTTKVSIRFRRSPVQMEQSRSAQISPNRGCLIISAGSRDNIFHTTANDKSMTSLSMASDTSNPVVLEIHEQIAISKVNNEETVSNKSDIYSDAEIMNVRKEKRKGVEIHVANSNRESTMNGKPNKHPQDGETGNGQPQDAPQISINELDFNQVSNNETTTPL